MSFDDVADSLIGLLGGLLFLTFAVWWLHRRHR